jgi:hypothetical protein
MFRKQRPHVAVCCDQGHIAAMPAFNRTARPDRGKSPLVGDVRVHDIAGLQSISGAVSSSTRLRVNAHGATQV